MAIGETSAQMAIRDPDVRLMLRIREDDPKAFPELVERYQSRLVGVLHHLIGNLDEAEDLAQEVFLRVYKTRKNYTPTAKFSTWLFTIANNLALNVLRQKSRRPSLTIPNSEKQSGESSPDYLVPSREGTPSTALKTAELSDRIHAALNQLNDRQRMAVLLNKFEEMGYAEIADVMQLSIKAVKSLLSRARCRLRELLQDYIAPDERTTSASSSHSAPSSHSSMADSSEDLDEES